MSAHGALLARFPSAYALAKWTGIPYRNCKRWASTGRISDPSAWLQILRAAPDIPQADYADWCHRLAEDY